MARSVSRHPSAVEVVFLHGILFESSCYDLQEGETECEPAWHYFDWGDFIEDLKGVIGERYPSFGTCDRWAGREDHVILENEAAEVSVAEYCGLISVSFAPKEGADWDYHQVTARNANWTGRIADNFREHLHSRFQNFAMIPMGSASNGEAFFRPASRPSGLVTSKEGELW